MTVWVKLYFHYPQYVIQLRKPLPPPSPPKMYILAGVAFTKGLNFTALHRQLVMSSYKKVILKVDIK